VPQPEYVPLTEADKVRPVERMPVPDGFFLDRPGELPGLRPPVGPRFGSPGPDQGYGLKLARRLADRVVVASGEQVEDALAGGVLVGLKRASIFGRAPVIYDMELALTLWGFLGSPPADLVAFRQPLFEGASHHYWDQRGIVDRTPESTLRLTPAEVAGRLGEWRRLLTTT
jgi:hypothetical protein